MFPVVVRVVNAPVLAVVEPIAPGTAQLVEGNIELDQVLPLDVKTLPGVPGAMA